MSTEIRRTINRIHRIINRINNYEREEDILKRQEDMERAMEHVNYTMDTNVYAFLRSSNLFTELKRLEQQLGKPLNLDGTPKPKFVAGYYCRYFRITESTKYGMNYQHNNAFDDPLYVYAKSDDVIKPSWCVWTDLTEREDWKKVGFHIECYTTTIDGTGRKWKTLAAAAKALYTEPDPDAAKAPFNGLQNYWDKVWDSIVPQLRPGCNVLSDLFKKKANALLVKKFFKNYRFGCVFRITDSSNDNFFEVPIYGYVVSEIIDVERYNDARDGNKIRNYLSTFLLI